MKKLLVSGCGLLASLCVSVSVWAMPAGGPPGPCKAIAEACKSAGFVKGGEAKGKGLMANCLKPLMSGQTVAGVSVTPEQIQACQAKRAAHGAGPAH